MNNYDWEAMIGELFMRGEFEQARTRALEFALWRDGRLTFPETVAAARASV